MIKIITFLFLFSGCAGLTLVEPCSPYPKVIQKNSPYSASCATTKGKKIRRLTHQEWGKMVDEGVLVFTIDDYKKRKKDILKLCKLAKSRCKDKIKGIDDWIDARSNLINKLKGAIK